MLENTDQKNSKYGHFLRIAMEYRMGILSINWLKKTVAYLELCQTSVMELFAKINSGF